MVESSSKQYSIYLRLSTGIQHLKEAPNPAYLSHFNRRVLTMDHMYVEDPIPPPRP